MKSKLLLLVFVLAAVLWSVVVIEVASERMFSFPPYLDYPWAGIVLGTFGGFLIGALGLRMYTIITHREDVRKLRTTSPPQVAASDWNEMQAPFEQEHREPYICTRSVVR